MNFSEEKFLESYVSLEGVTPDELIAYVEPKAEQESSFDSIRQCLADEERMNIKFGTEPTGPDLYIGHVVPIRIIDIFVVPDIISTIDLILGDFTAKVGDPSGRSNELPILADEKIAENVSTFRAQIDKYFDTNANNVRVSHDSEWLNDMSFSTSSDICKKLT